MIISVKWRNLGCFTEGTALEPALEGWRGGGHVVLWSKNAGMRSSTGMWAPVLMPEWLRLTRPRGWRR